MNQNKSVNNPIESPELIIYRKFRYVLEPSGKKFFYFSNEKFIYTFDKSVCFYDLTTFDKKKIINVCSHKPSKAGTCS